MKNSIVLLSILGALGAGFGIGVLSTRAHFEKAANKRADDEIESMRAYFMAEKKGCEHDAGNDFDESITVTPSKVHFTDIPSFREYSTFSSVATVTVDRVSELESRIDDMAERERPREGDAQKPYFITIDDFDEVTIGYAKKELVYYMDDGTLLDENENVDEEGQVLSIVDTVGTKNLEMFENSIESVCYIRNEQLKEDYEISKIFGSYGALLGE